MTASVREFRTRRVGSLSVFEERVQIFSVATPKPGTLREDRRYRVKWRIEGRDKTRSFKTKTEAERLRTRLRMAVIDGERFDVGTGLPVGWTTRPDTWWDWSQKWLAMKWPQWSGHTRRSAVESLVALTPALVHAGAAPPPDDLAEWLRMFGFRPGGELRAPAPVWLTRWSVPLVDLTPAVIESALIKATSKRDGSPVSPEVARRRRTMLGAVVRSAARRGLINGDPLGAVEWKPPNRTLAVDIATVPSYEDVLEAVDHVASFRTDGARYAALFAAVGIAGLRPSEAIGLRISDLTLPTAGWGLAVLRGATTSPGARYTASGEVVESKQLKQRPINAVREVPLAPDLVWRLLTHLERWQAADRVFSNGAGRTPTTTNYGPVWVRARRKLWPSGHLLEAVTVYDLRHSAATMMLRAAVPPAEVARRLGHSVDVLMRVYAGVFDGERQRSNELIALAIEQGKRRDPRS